ncbi:uncharacterized protein LOC111831737 [Capsella rubella]|uniref:uncharacterized protein LOC111831737 n=1 Tax=Capsella rubella TaxID=81985 RepID=UPI000CD583EB|nr:uncharacterized protein LOC111831737 [Capsella rubella]
MSNTDAHREGRDDVVQVVVEGDHMEGVVGGDGGGIQANEDGEAEAAMKACSCKTFPEGILRRVESGFASLFYHPEVLFVFQFIFGALGTYFFVNLKNFNPLLLSVYAIGFVLFLLNAICEFGGLYMEMRIEYGERVRLYRMTFKLLKCVGNMAVLGGFVVIGNMIEITESSLGLFAIGESLSFYLLLVSFFKFIGVEDLFGCADGVMTATYVVWINNHKNVLKDLSLAQEISSWVGFVVITVLFTLYKITPIWFRCLDVSSGGRGNGERVVGAGNRGGIQVNEEADAAMKACKCTNFPECFLRCIESGFASMFFHPEMLVLFQFIFGDLDTFFLLKLKSTNYLVIAAVVISAILFVLNFACGIGRVYVKMRTQYSERYRMTLKLFKCVGNMAVLGGFVFIGNMIEITESSLGWFAIGISLSLYLFLVSLSKFIGVEDLFGCGDAVMAATAMLVEEVTEVVLSEEETEEVSEEMTKLME